MAVLKYWDSTAGAYVPLLAGYAANAPVGGSTPIGGTIAFAGATAPAGWFLCQGQAVSRTSYPELFTVCGVTYGIGDGSTTFNVPDLMARIPVGHWTGSANFNALGKKGGEESHTVTVAQMPMHQHGQVVTANNQAGIALRYDYIGDAAAPGAGAYDQGYKTYPEGGGQAMNILQYYTVMQWIIRAL